MALKISTHLFSENCTASPCVRLTGRMWLAMKRELKGTNTELIIRSKNTENQLVWSQLVWINIPNRVGLLKISNVNRRMRRITDRQNLSCSEIWRLSQLISSGCGPRWHFSVTEAKGTLPKFHNA